MAKNDSYAGQLLDEIKLLKEENEKLKKNYETVKINLDRCRQDYEERTTEVLTLERRIQKLAENPYNSHALCLIKEIDQLNGQIEKMKCCFNCKYHDTGNCKLSPNNIFYCDANWVCAKWEMKE